ncbi:MAG: hypothetical protein KF768_03720 [Phycisphaeraceae bacterium]|nr:hypothetical protein [Phycisphaeraceae bacterium]
MPATDRDLLVLEPLLFRDVGFAATMIARGTGSLNAGLLTISGLNLPALGITTGHVAIIDGLPVEVLATSGSGVTVSLLRPTDASPPINPGNQTSKPASISSFVPHIRAVHDQLIRDFGLDPASAALAPSAIESSITNPEALTRASALGALALIWGAIDTDRARERAALYRRRFAAERERVRLFLDLDGDGLPEAVRTLVSAQLTRG